MEIPPTVQRCEPRDSRKESLSMTHGLLYIIVNHLTVQPFTKQPSKALDMISCQQFLVLLILSSGAAEAFGRYTVAKQHEAPLLAIDDFRDHRR